jgi:hypothetical protein
MRRIVVARTAAAVAIALVCATALAACEGRRSAGESGAGNDPVAAARDFITDGVVDHNGFQACAYLTAAQRRVVSRSAGVDECREAFDEARLTLGRHHVQTVHQVERLSADVATDGNWTRVRMGRDGASIELRLVKATAAEEEDEFQPPDTEWRIAGGALALMPSAAHG